jgi:hypothetical protein
LKWDDVRNQHPQRWVLVDALRAHRERKRRLLDELDVVGVFVDSPSALKSYSTLHHATPNRELYVFHSSHKDLSIEERQRLGVRAAG